MKKRILSTLLVLCMVLVMLPGTAWAAEVDSGTCGNFTNWSLDSNGTLTISGIGSMSDNGWTGVSDIKPPWNKYRADIRSIVVSNGVTRIGDEAFYGCSNLTSVKIANTVAIIGSRAFSYCSNLPQIDIPTSVTNIESGAFTSCTKLTKVTIPTGVVSLGSSAFWGCTNLTSVTIPSTVLTMGDSLFYGCSSLRSITIPNGITSIGRSTFYGCSGLTKIVIPDSVVSLGDAVFSKCTSLTSVTLPNDIGSISGYMFNGCSNLRNIVIPDGVTSIKEHAFERCSALASITIPDSVISIENSAFVGCGKLSNIYYSGTEAQWKDISIGAQNSSLSSATKHYNSTSTPSTPTPPATQTYTITLNANGGKVSPATLKVESGKTYYSSLPTPTRSGYKFTGWYTAKTGGTKIASTAKATKNQTIYAHWAKTRTYIVTFDANGGEVFQDFAAVVNGTYYRNLPTPVYPGRHFVGWYTAKSGGTKITNTRKVNLSANQTLYARWSTAAVKATKTQSGSWKIAVPADCTLVLYSSSTSAAKASSITVGSAGRVLNCTSMATLSNGTVRYRTSVNGRNYWFCYSSEMSVN